MTERPSPALFEFPPQARVARVVPKSKIFQHGGGSTALRACFARQVAQITWQYKLAPTTINLPARAGIEEIEIFDIALKAEAIDEAVLRAIDRAIPLPIVFQLHHGSRTRMVAAHKRPSAARAGQWVIDNYFGGDWLPADAPRRALPVALDLHGLYEQLLRSLLPLPPRPGERLAEQLARLARLRSHQHEHDKLEARLQREKQFNRKILINAQLRQLKDEIDRLSA